jgi:hypothetical protein
MGWSFWGLCTQLFYLIFFDGGFSTYYLSRTKSSDRMYLFYNTNSSIIILFNVRSPAGLLVVHWATSSPKILYIQRTFSIIYIMNIVALMISPNSAQHVDFSAIFFYFHCKYFKSYRYISVVVKTKTKKKTVLPTIH